MSKWISSVKTANDKIARLHKTTARAREKAGELVENVVHTVENVGSGFLWGYLEGKIEDPAKFEIIKGVPYPLAVGGVAKLFSILGVGRGMEGHLNEIGNGSLNAHFNGVGRNLGKRSRLQDRDASAYPVRGELSGAASRQGYGVTASDLARMVA